MLRKSINDEGDIRSRALGDPEQQADKLTVRTRGGCLTRRLALDILEVGTGGCLDRSAMSIEESRA